MITSPDAVTAVWTERHHPLVRNALAELSQASPQRRRPLVESLIRLVGSAFKFYASILSDTLPGLDTLIPVNRVVSTLKLDLKPERKSQIDDDIAVHIVHRCVIYIADLSRYRTYAAKTYLPTGSISKQDNNNYSKSIELYKLALLILPSHGDPYNHIAIIDNAKNDKFNVVYNFIRASQTSVPLPVAYSNLINLISKNPKSNTIFNKFIHCNDFNRNNMTKNDRMELLRSQFLVLFNYYLMPGLWSVKSKNNDSELPKLIGGFDISDIENDFYFIMSKLDYHKQIFNDFYFKQIAILTGGFELLIDGALNKDETALDHSPEIIEQYLKFIMRYIEAFLKITTSQWEKQIETGTSESDFAFSTSLLPSLRLVINWLNARSLPRTYLNQLPHIQSLVGGIINKLYDFFESQFDDNIDQLYAYVGSQKPDLGDKKKLQLKHLLSNKPHRNRLFKEDVTIREFKPVGYVFGDFDDENLYIKNENAVMALIGESTIIDKSNDNYLRLLATVVMSKDVLSDTDLKWNNDCGLLGRYVIGITNLEFSTQLTRSPANKKSTNVSLKSDKGKNGIKSKSVDAKKSKQQHGSKARQQVNSELKFDSIGVNNDINAKITNNNNNSNANRPFANPNKKQQSIGSKAMKEQDSSLGYAGASFSNFDSKLPQSIKMPFVREETKDDQFANMVASIVEEQNSMPTSSGSSIHSSSQNNIPSLQQPWYSQTGIWSTQQHAGGSNPLTQWSNVNVEINSQHQNNNNNIPPHMMMPNMTHAMNNISNINSLNSMNVMNYYQRYNNIQNQGNASSNVPVYNNFPMQLPTSVNGEKATVNKKNS